MAFFRFFVRGSFIQADVSELDPEEAALYNSLRDLAQQVHDAVLTVPTRRFCDLYPRVASLRANRTARDEQVLGAIVKSPSEESGFSSMTMHGPM